MAAEAERAMFVAKPDLLIELNVVSSPRKRESRACCVRPSLDARWFGHDSDVLADPCGARTPSCITFGALRSDLR